SSERSPAAGARSRRSQSSAPATSPHATWRPAPSGTPSSTTSSWTDRRPAMRLVERRIPMSDGVHLTATLFLPEQDPGGDGFPAVLEYLPYRKDDAMIDRDYDLYSYLVPRGYVGARVDIRGTGASEGVLPDGEYTEQEQLDGMEVIAWLARQPWSNGNV